MQQRKYDLENRLIDFGVMTINICETINSKREAGRHLSKQLVRSGTSPGIHYGEAQSSESRKDFIHKMKIVHKELHETRANLKMIQRAKLHQDLKLLVNAINESTELIKIFEKSIQTAKRNLGKKE